jgi:hypothetical protein
MPARDTPARFRRFALAICLALAALWLPGCQRGAGPGQSTVPGVAVEPAALRPVDAVYLLRDRLLARDGAGFARLAVPPALHGEPLTAGALGRSRWPTPSARNASSPPCPPPRCAAASTARPATPPSPRWA